MRRLLLTVITTLIIGTGIAEAQLADRAKQRWALNAPIIDSIVVTFADTNGEKPHFNAEEVKGRLHSRERTFWRAIKGDRRSKVQRETLARDTLAITFMYLTSGFLEMQVKHQYEILPPDSHALVVIEISEGRQFRTGPVRVDGDFERRFAGELNSIAHRIKTGEPLNILAVRQAAFDMKTVLANGGYPYATVNHSIDTSGGADAVPVDFSIRADSLVRFGDLIVEGTHVYPERAASREVKFESGDVYSRQSIIESQQRLFEAGYFTTFRLQQADTVGHRLNPDFLLRVRERNPHFFSFDAGAGQSEQRDLIWNLGAGIGKRNLPLRGTIRGELTADYSFTLGSESRLIEHIYSASFSELWILGIRAPFSITGEWEPRIKDATRDFKKRAWSVSAETRFRFGEKIRTTFGIQYQEVKITGVPEDEVLRLKEDEGLSARRKLYGTYRRDSRNDIFVPTWGSVTELSGEYYGGFLGGDDSFFKLGTAWSRYQPVWPGWILATRIKLGWAEEFGKSQAVPSDEILLLGGANSIRGFKENSLGPLSAEGRVEGARLTGIFNAEFRWETLQLLAFVPVLKQFPLWQSLFLDVGNGFRNRQEIALDELALSYGTGFQLVSPAGPIRVDYARRIQTKRYPLDDRWHFTILYAF